MRKYLLPEKGEFYKANLHSHSTLSDGRMTPEEMKAEYKMRGYKILAVSDHDALHEHNALTEEDFLMLTAYEISIRSDDDPMPHAFRKVVDLNLFAKEPYNLTQCGYHPETVDWLVKRGKLTKEEQANIKYTGELRDLYYYPENINKIVKTANEAGFLVSLNHPEWNNITAEDYLKYEGLWAVEVYNHGCYADSGLYDSEAVFDDFLRSGKQIFATATDDNHNWADGTYRCDSFGGFTMIKAEKLDYASVIGALERGEFYASSGPLIEELYFEDGYCHIKTSPAADISLLTLGRRGERIASENGEPVTEAKFKIDPENYGLVRFRVRDLSGKKAWTNAYYTDEFCPGAKKVRTVR